MAEIQIVAETDTVTIREQLSLSVIGRDKSSQSVPLESVKWSSSQEAVATVSAAGEVTALRSGTTTITAAARGVTGAFDLVVRGTLHKASLLSSNAVWREVDGPHIVEGELRITGQLTIEAGVEMRMGKDAILNATDGIIRVRGSDAAPVSFVANRKDAPPGFWGGIVTGLEAEIMHATLTHCGTPGLIAACITATREVLVHDVAIEHSGGVGISHLGAGFSPLSNHVAIRGSAGYPLAVTSMAMSTIPTDIELVDNGRQAVLIAGGAGHAAGEWRALGIPYEVRGDLYVDAGTRLTLPPGTDIRWLDDRGFWVYGVLDAVGTESQPVRMTSGREDPQAGYWAGLFLGGVEQSNLQHLVLAHCGTRNGACLSLLVPRAQLMRNIEVRQSGSWGMSMRGWFDHGSENILIAQTALNPLDIHAAGLFSIPTSISFSEPGISSVLVRGGVVDRSQTWPDRGYPYDVTDGFILVWGTSTVLEITPGLQIRFDTHSGIGVHEGMLVADGTAEQPITFTASAADPLPGSWWGLHFSTGAATGNRLDHVVVEYGGGNAGGGIASWEGMIRLDVELGGFITNSTIRGSAICGVERNYGVTTDLQDPAYSNTFADNAVGDQC